ncbi:Vi polysaccharide biosynthesis protein TviA [Citrobacter braakii]|uniref:Vi polysaccharide biosynthesis protein TviA n=1 Tax=Citrobacter braakii TaxID=57706 RepID=UPI0039B542F2
MIFTLGGGAASVIDEMSLITNERNYLFVNLNQYSLRSTLVFFSRNKDINKIIIIISSSRLMPLALFWLDNIKNVIAVFDTSTPVSEMIKKISLYRRNGDKITAGRRECNFKISNKDIMKMKYFLTESGMEELQDRFMNSPSTLYRWRKEIALKFGVRDPRYLLLPE